MNTITMMKDGLSVRLFAAITIVSLLLSAFPVAFFVAEAAPGNNDANGTVSLRVNPDPASGNEFVNVSFSGTGTLNLEGWTIDETIASVRQVYTFGVVTLDSGDEFQICNGGGCDDVFSVGGNIWNDTGDTAVLRDESGNEIVSTSWSTAVGDTEVPGTASVNYVPVGPVENTDTGETFTTVQAAIDDTDTDDGDTIVMGADETISTRINVDKELIIDGNGHTIDAAFTKDGNSDNAAFGVGSDNVTIQNITVDGKNGIDLHGINVYQATGVNISNVTAMNFRTGLLVNGSSVTASDITTLGNTWHGINVDQGSGVTQSAELTISNTSAHAENSATPPSRHVDGINVPHIFVDDATANVSISDTDTQYNQAEVDWRGQRADVYTLKSAPVVKETETIKVSGDTAVAENQPGWMFGRDSDNTTPIEFNSDESVIGNGALYVAPISATDQARKFIGEFFYLDSIADLHSFSYDFKVGAGGTDADANDFYLNVYANFAGVPVDNFYHCRYQVVPTVGTTGAFTTVTFDTTNSYPVTTRSSSPYQCPAIPAQMDISEPGASIRAISLNLGDTSLSDANLDGYFDNVVLETDTKITTFDFDRDTNTPEMADIKMYVERSGVFEESYVVRPGDTVRVEVQATDIASGVEDVEFRIQSLDGQYVAARTFVDTPVEDNTYRFEYQVPTDGRYINTHNSMNLDIDGHRFWARATDNAGNYNNGLSGNFTFDTVVPEMSNITMFVERNGTYQESSVVEQGDNVRIEVDAFDIASDIRDVEFRIQSQDGQYVAPRTYINTPFQGSTYRFEYQVPADSRYINTHNLMNETIDGHRFWARATDEVGNYNHGVSNDFTFSVDEEKPFMEVIHPEDGQVFTEDFDIRIQATDDLGLTQVVINLKDESGGHVAACLNEQAGGAIDYTTSCRVDVDALTPGIYGFKANAMDTTGKISNTVSQSFEIQEEIPESVTITTPATSSQIVSGVYDFTAEYIDNDNTPDAIQWAIRADSCTSSNATVAGNVDGFSDGSTFSESVFSATLDTSAWLNGEYCLVVDPNEGPGEEDLRATQTFTVENFFTISGVKWDDVNTDGEIDESESTLSGWTISLSEEIDEGSSSISTTTTDGSGEYSFIVPAGTWTVTEEAVTGWTQTGQYLNGEVIATGTNAFGSCTFNVPVDSAGETGYTCSFGNHEDAEDDSSSDTVIPASTGGGSSGGTLVERVAQPAPLVLGVTTDRPEFCPFLTEYMQIGTANNTFEVMKLQAFLNTFKDTFGGTENPITGTFGTITDANVRAFQETYRSEILDPWSENGSLLQPTGFVYLTTKWKINDIVCPGVVPKPEL